MIAPVAWTDAIMELILEEAESMRKARGVKAPPDTEPEEPEIEKVRTVDGYVRTQRKLTAGDQAVHSVFGVPPSYRK